MSIYTKISPLIVAILGSVHISLHKWKLVGGFGDEAFVTHFMASYCAAGFLSLAYMAITNKFVSGKWFLLFVTIMGIVFVFTDPVVKFS